MEKGEAISREVSVLKKGTLQSSPPKNIGGIWEIKQLYLHEGHPKKGGLRRKKKGGKKATSGSKSQGGGTNKNGRLHRHALRTDGYRPSLLC